MRNWLKTTLAAGLVAVTGAAMVGCGCDTEINYKDAMTAYHEVFTVTDDVPQLTADAKKAADKGFTFEYTKTEKSFGTDGKETGSVKTKLTVKSVLGTDGASQITKVNKVGATDEATQVINFAKTKENGAAADAATAYYFFDGNNKKIADNTAAKKAPIDLATAFQANVLLGIFNANNVNTDLLDGVTELGSNDDYKNVDDVVAEYNKKYNKDLSAENTTKKELTSKFLKTGDASYKLTLKVTESTWKGADKTADVNTMEVTYEFKDKAITKLIVKSTSAEEGKSKADVTCEATFDYAKPSLNIPANLAEGDAANADALIAEYADQFPAASD